MSDQLGFDFGDSVPHRPVAQTPGTWSDPEFTTSQYKTMFTKAQDVLQSVSGPARVLFARGLESAGTEHARMTHHDNDNLPYHLWRVQCPVADQEFACFVDHCRLMLGVELLGIEFKMRVQLAGLTAAMHVHGLGTLLASRWSADNFAIDFRPWRDSFFLDSYRDHMPLIEAPYTLWGKAYCADKLAESGQGVADVPTFMLNGREYINDGGSGNATYRECEGWTFCALADWDGPIYNYRSQCRAWDDGTLERGDRRGLAVRVRRQKCVLEGAASIYDTQVKNTAFVETAAD